MPSDNSAVDKVGYVQNDGTGRHRTRTSDSQSVDSVSTPSDQNIKSVGFSSLLTAGGILDTTPIESARRNRRDKAIVPRDGRVPTLGQMANDYRRASPTESESIDAIIDDENVGKTAPVTEATGRWTKLEHETFLKALRKYGKEWKKVAAMVHTRTVVQTRTHAQKYFQKMNKHHTESDNEGSDDGFDKLAGSGVSWSATTTSKRAKLTSPPAFSPPHMGLHVNTTMRVPDDLTTAPSPAACGKRKKEELAAAAVLLQAASPSQLKASQLLSSMKKSPPPPSLLSPLLPPLSSFASSTSSNLDKRRPISLRVTNPDVFTRGRSKSTDEPSTPWDSEVERLGRDVAPSSITSNDPFSQSELHAAVISGSLHQVRLVISAMSEDDFMGSLVHVVNQPDSLGRTPLLSAAALTTAPGAETEAQVEATTLSLVLLLLEHGADPAVTDDNLNTVLHWASARGRASLVAELLKYPACSAIVNFPNRLGDTPLLWASALCHSACIKVLLEAGANLTLRNNLSHSPLDVAGSGLERPDISMPALSAEDRVATRRTLYEGDPRSRTLVLSHGDCLGHMPRSQSDWECPERITDVMDAVSDAARFNPDHQEIEFSSDFDKATAEFLGRAHCAEYIKFVSDLARQMKDMEGSQAVPFTPQVRKYLKTPNYSGKPNACDTSFSVGSLDAARRAAGAVMTAVDRVLRGRNRNAFCIVRPPGHHAGTSGLLADASSHGFCIFNSVAAGALHALESQEHRLSRVAIIDIDVHHGNGTEEIVRSFQSPDRLLFFSIHLYDKETEANSTNNSYEFYPGSGSADQTASNIINVPLVPLWRATSRTVTRGRTKRGEEDLQATQSGRRGFRHGIMTRLLPALRAFNPELVLLSSGFDAAQSDVGNGGVGDAAGLDLTPEDFFWVTKEVQQIADMCCEGRVVSVLEGGYGCKVDMSKPGTFGVKASPQSSSQSSSQETIQRSQLDRTHLANAACAHLRGLVDPYAVLDETL